MSTIALLRSKGLTDQEIQDIINQRQSRLIVDVYTKGFRQGVRSTIEGLFAATKLANQTDKELAS